MNDLDMVEQYFRRELTESEKQGLDELLERSPEAAELFQERARAAYRPHSLPELKLPRLPPQPPPRGGSSIRLSKWLWLLAGYGLLAATIWFWSRNHEIHWPWDPPEPVLLSSPAVSPAGSGRNLDSPWADATGTDTDLALAMGAPPTPEDEGDDAVAPVPVTALSPSTLEHPGLRILVDRPVPGLVTVKVLDASGSEIRTLYSGALQAGRWAFEWNGRLADGSRAAIGTYTLQARSGSTVQKQEVWIDR